MPKAILIDTTRCTACRGCQVSCKEWKNLPPVATKQRGTHQNPPDLTHANYKLVRFSEHLEGDLVKWYFFPDQCRHCLEPPCKATADSKVPGAIIVDEKTRAVLYTEKTKQLTQKQFQEVLGACPYNIPRRDPVSKLVVKCDLCIERVRANRLPMCVKSCAMGAMNFGERADLLKLAAERLAAVQKEFPKAALLNQDDVSVIYLVADAPEKYHKFASADSPAGLMTRQQMLAGLFAAPLRKIGRQLPL
jgi:formate dehydrogenase iron-sulfur subunit